MARPTPGRAQFHYLESWLLPSLGLRANVFHFNPPGYERPQDYYLDIGMITVGDTAWHTEDHYLDLVSTPVTAPTSSTPTSCSPPTARACCPPRPRRPPCSALSAPWPASPVTTTTSMPGFPPRE